MQGLRRAGGSSGASMDVGAVAEKDKEGGDGEDPEGGQDVGEEPQG